MRYPKFQHRARGHLRATTMAFPLVQAGRARPPAAPMLRRRKRQARGGAGGRLRGIGAGRALVGSGGHPELRVPELLVPELVNRN